MSYRFELASPADDQGLLDLVRVSTMPGAISILMDRQPSMFAGGRALGHVHQVMVARHGTDPKIVGVGERAERRLYVNAEPSIVGYLSGVRIHPDHRGGTMLLRGFRHLRTLHEGGVAPFYLTTIAADNLQAQAALAANRPGMPTYTPLGTYLTLCVPVRQGDSHRTRPDLDVSEAAEGNIDELVEYWTRVGPQRQLFPVLDARSLRAGPEDQAAGPAVTDVLLARRDRQIVGTLARWDQSQFKQIRILGYGAGLRLLRPVYNLVAPWVGWPAMPAAGQSVSTAYGTWTCVDRDDPAVFSALLDRALARERSRGTAYWIQGMHEGDPLRPSVEAHRPFRLTSILYTVTFGDATAQQATLDGRPWVVDVGTL